MLRKTLEVIFGHLRQLFALVALPVVLSLGVVYVLPRTYQATATLWALRRYEIIGATGPEADLLSSPSTTQATALQELLQTRTFALAVASDANLAATLDSTLRANAQARDDALFQDISKGVIVTDQGYNLFTITYINQSPTISQQVVQATIKNYGLQSSGYSIAEGQQLLAAYQSQLTTAKQNAASAAQASAQYLRDHGLTAAQAAVDPEYQLLNGQAQQAQANLLNLQNAISQVNQELTTIGTGADGLFLIIDAPQVPDRAVSRLKNILLGGGVGLGLALLACALYILVLVRRNHAILSPGEAERLTQLPVVMQLPELPHSVVSLAVTVGSMTVRGQSVKVAELPSMP
ncbi:MAG TPA: hypothetical protein VIG30_02055 [Ktedonobacterales bacterium]|jgi:hypothetical protein